MTSMDHGAPTGGRPKPVTKKQIAERKKAMDLARRIEQQNKLRSVKDAVDADQMVDEELKNI